MYSVAFPVDIGDGGSGLVTPSGFSSFSSASSWTLNGDLEPDHPAGTIETETSLQVTYRELDASPTASFSIGALPGVAFRDPRFFYRLPMPSGSNSITGNSFDGCADLILTGTDQASVDFYNELQNVLGTTQFAAVGNVGSVHYTGTGYIVDVTMTFTPIITSEDVSATTSPVTTLLLGGGGVTGGIGLDFVEGISTGGEVAASFEALDEAEFEQQQADLYADIGTLGVEFAGGQAQMWDVDFGGDATGSVTVTFTYDDSAFGPDFDETILQLVHVHDDGTVELLSAEDVTVDPVSNTISFDTTGFSSFVLVAPPDSDGDGVPDDHDICPGGDDNVDFDGDLVPDFCDQCPNDAGNDADGDGVCGDIDACPGGDDNVDTDGDAVPDFCDPCPNDAGNDADGDGVCGDVDVCPGGDDNQNADGDSLPDFCDVCPLDPENDADGDGICANDDNCPLIANENQADLDEDLVGDACDDDIDGDGVPNTGDNCVFDVNPDQDDFDWDGAGDICDTDIDDDGVLDADDACVPSPLGDVVNADGCAISELCPCAHPDGADRWKNHGAYVSCVAHTSEDFVATGLITEAEKDAIVSAAAESTCGHKNK